VVTGKTYASWLYIAYIFYNNHAAVLPVHGAQFPIAPGIMRILHKLSFGVISLVDGH
jgi:hypothetical protein